MSQQSILDLLRKSKRPLSIKEMKEQLGLGQSAVARACNILFTNNEIERKKIVTVDKRTNIRYCIKPYNRPGSQGEYVKSFHVYYIKKNK